MPMFNAPVLLGPAHERNIKKDGDSPQKLDSARGKVSICAVYLEQGYLEGLNKETREHRKLVGCGWHLYYARTPSMLLVSCATLALMRATRDSIAGRRLVLHIP